MEFNESISISQSPEKIWDFWMPVTTDTQWRNGITKAEWTTQPPYGVGSCGVHYNKDLGAIPWTIIKWQDKRLMEWVIGDSKLKGSIGSYRVEPENGGSRVTLRSKLQMGIIMRFIMLFMGGKMKQGFKDDLQRLKAIMEK